MTTLKNKKYGKHVRAFRIIQQFSHCKLKQ